MAQRGKRKKWKYSLCPHFWAKKTRQRPTLPRGSPRSTIGTGGLNFRVRNGIGCFPSVLVARINLQMIQRQFELFSKDYSFLSGFDKFN